MLPISFLRPEKFLLLQEKCKVSEELGQNPSCHQFSSRLQVRESCLYLLNLKSLNREKFPISKDHTFQTKFVLLHFVMSELGFGQKNIIIFLIFI